MVTIGMRVVSALLISLVACAATAPSRAAPAAATPGGAWTSVRDQGVRGIALVEWQDEAGDTARLSLHVTGLAASDRLRVVLSSAPCGSAATGPTRRWAHRLEVGGNGRVWRARVALTLDRGTLADVRSVRLMEEEGIFSACRAPAVWDDTDIVHARNGAVAVLDGARGQGIVVVGPSDATGSLVTWSLTLGDGPDPRLVATTSGCGRAVEPGARVLSLPVSTKDDGTAFHRGRTETVDKDETIAIRAIRVRSTDGDVLACRRPAIIAVRPS